MQASGHSNARSTTLGVRPSSTNLKALIQELERRTKGEVRFDDGSRALYSTDSSNYRQTPIGVVLPRDQEDVVETVAVCRNFGVPITGRGGGTSLAGQCCNVAVILDFSKYMHRLLAIDPAKKLVRVEPGIIYDHLNRETAKYKLAFGPDPSTHNHCTISGRIPLTITCDQAPPKQQLMSWNWWAFK
jgi:FAD/FMN-containing dehydrogenase